jgi:hypothetical protein
MNEIPQAMNNQSVPMCALCKTLMEPLMQMPVRVGGGQGFFIGFQELSERILTLDTYRCPNCRRLDFFDLDLSLPQR